MTKSATTQPRLLFARVRHGKHEFYSSPQPDEETSHVVADNHMSFPLRYDPSEEVHPPLHGLICLTLNTEETTAMICNPSTGQYLTVPVVKPMRNYVKSFFGYDPVGKHFKLLMVTHKEYMEHHVLTLVNGGKLFWRMIECSIPHSNSGDGICINGVLYYHAIVKRHGGVRIVCFDVRSEKFSLIEENDQILGGKFVNYKGKLATVKSVESEGWFSVESKSLELCVLEDAEKNEWSVHTYVLPPSWTDLVSPLGMVSNGVTRPLGMVVNGITRTGEMVLSPQAYLSSRCYLLYYNLERNTIRKVEIHGIGEHRELYTFIDHVEDVKLGGVFESP